MCTGDRVVQFVMDGTAANAKAWTLIELVADSTWFANYCTLHGTGLHFKHMVSGDQSATPLLEPIAGVVSMVEKTKLVEQQFTNRGFPAALLKKYSKKHNKRSRRSALLTIVCCTHHCTFVGL